MKRNLQINKRWMHVLLLLVASFALLSCGGYYYADGVYYDPVPERPSYLEIVEEPAYTPVENRYAPNRYKDYFGEKAQQYRQVPDTSFTHFTDVNSYRSNATSGAPAYGGWGSNPSQVNVNVYNNSPWGYNSWGYNNWYPNYGYDSYYRNRARWSLSFGWGWGSYYDLIMGIILTEATILITDIITITAQEITITNRVVRTAMEGLIAAEDVLL